jgi:hypothetical protein
MTTKNKTQKVNFSKFFPDNDAFVTLRGAFNPDATSPFDDEFDLDFTIQSATNRSINLYSWLSGKDHALDQLKAIQEATAKAIKFYEDVAAAKKEAKKSKPIDFAPKRVLKTRK